MLASFAVSVVYYEGASLKHELALFSAGSADEAEGLAIHDVVTGGGKLVSILSFSSPVGPYPPVDAGLRVRP